MYYEVSDIEADKAERERLGLTIINMVSWHALCASLEVNQSEMTKTGLITFCVLLITLPKNTCSKEMG